ncbi:MAG: hypothetical protein ACOH10_12905 [Rhodoglobus sp.]
MQTATETPTRTITTNVPVHLRCLACAEHLTVVVSTRGRLAGLLRSERDLLDAFVSTHDAAQIHRP